MAVGNDISVNDYNNIRAKIDRILGSGTGQEGYGQSLISKELIQLDGEWPVISPTEWQQLRFDIINAKKHQDGTDPIITDIAKGQLIRFSSTTPNFQYSTIADSAITNKLNVGPGQFFVLGRISLLDVARDWRNQVIVRFRVRFQSSNHARWFFNSGGQLRFTSAISAVPPTPQNVSWSRLLADQGTVVFSSFDFYNAAFDDRVLLNARATGAYSLNSYNIMFRSNISNNVNGGATELFFTVTYTDGYTGPTDVVSGPLQLFVEEQRATGVMLPAGSDPFTITPPSFDSLVSQVIA